MKITIEPTEEAIGSALYHTVSISMPADDLSTGEVAQMCQQLLLGFGYPPKRVAEAFGEDDE